MSSGLEIERKYLIRMPDEGRLRAMPGCCVWDIVQRYLHSGADGSTRRVRRILEKDEYSYFYTCKRHINDLSQQEDETEISESVYNEMLLDADPELRPVVKRRFRIPYCGKTLEVDIFSFWNDRAILEIELESEDQQAVIPEWIDVVREVTPERAYKNNRLAKEVPMEDIGL